MSELLTFVETSVFTKRMAALGLEDSLRGLQPELLDNPETGDVEPGMAGLRKTRLGDPTRGKGSAEALVSITCGTPIGAAFI